MEIITVNTSDEDSVQSSKSAVLSYQHPPPLIPLSGLPRLLMSKWLQVAVDKSTMRPVLSPVRNILLLLS